MSETKPDSEKPEVSESTRLTRSILIGIMLCSGLFLLLRMFFDVDVDPALIAGAFVGVSGGMLFYQTAYSRRQF